MKKTILLAGASGLIGKSLYSSLKDQYDFIILGRNNSASQKSLPNAKSYIQWSDENALRDAVNQCDVVINLAGAGIADKRWTPSYKKIILESRTESTRSLITSIKSATKKPALFISASGIGIYGDRGNQTLTESSSIGDDFLAKVCDLWESESNVLNSLGVRRVVLRIGVVLSNKGGALMKMVTPFKFFIGGKLGSGNQFLSWIHIDDLISVFREAIENENYFGIINVVSPNPVTMGEFAGLLGKVMNRPSIFPVPEIVLKLILGESAIMVLGGQNVVPKKLLEYNFHFKFSNAEDALHALL